MGWGKEVILTGYMQYIPMGKVIQGAGAAMNSHAVTSVSRDREILPLSFIKLASKINEWSNILESTRVKRCSHLKT